MNKYCKYDFYCGCVLNIFHDRNIYKWDKIKIFKTQSILMK